MQCSKNNFNINIIAQPTTCKRTLFCPNIAQLLKENIWAIVAISFASMQQHCRLVNWVAKKMFEMKILKMTHLAYLIVSNLKVIVCQNVNLSHTYRHHPQKHPLVI